MTDSCQKITTTPISSKKLNLHPKPEIEEELKVTVNLEPQQPSIIKYKDQECQFEEAEEDEMELENNYQLPPLVSHAEMST
jgi:hypothetical protein